MAFGHKKEQGRRTVLREISRSGKVPRIDLASRTGISPATVTSITADLLRGGLIEEVRQHARASSGSRGRPKVDLKIAGAAHMVAGLKVAGTKISVVMLDFEGKDRAELELDIGDSCLSPDELATAINISLSQLCQAAGVGRDRISGLGIGLAGMVEAETGLVYWSPSLSARNINLGTVLQDKLGLPVFLDNDANLVAMAELKFGLGSDHRDFLVVTIESGVGMGMVFGGQVYRGARGCGAEFGHTKVAIEGAACRCGQQGCLEAYVADYALVRDAGTIPGFVLEGTRAQQVAQVLNAAKEGNESVRRIVDRAGKVFAVGLANLVNLFDPELVIIAGEQMQFDHLYADRVIEEMRKSIVVVDKAPPEVVIHKWGDLMWAKGAAAYALEFVQDIAVRELDRVG